MATIYNFTDGTIAGQMIPDGHTKGRSRKTPARPLIPIDSHLFVLRNTVDFSKQTLDVSETDVARVLNIEAGTTVLDVWARIATAETADAILNLGYGSDVDRWGHSLAMDVTGVVPTVYVATVTWDAASINEAEADTAGEEAKEITVNGAQLGEICHAHMSIDVIDLAVTAQVTATDTVTAQLINVTGAAIDLDSATLTVMVDKAPLRRDPLYFSAADTIDLQGISTVDCDALIIEVCALCYKAL